MVILHSKLVKTNIEWITISFSNPTDIIEKECDVTVFKQYLFEIVLILTGVMSCVQDQEVIVKESLLAFLKDNIPQSNLRLGLE